MISLRVNQTIIVLYTSEVKFRLYYAINLYDGAKGSIKIRG